MSAARPSLPEGSVVWITGAGSGIGRAGALLFAREGATVVLSGRSRARLARVAREIGKEGGIAHVVPCDVRSAASVAGAMRAIARRAGRVDVLINNAGISPVTPFTRATVKELDECLATNLRGTFLCAKAVVPGMIARRRGVIINVLSTAAVRAFPGNGAYCASKFGALGLTKVMRTELKRHRIRVIAVLPGAVETPMWDAASRARYRTRMLQPEDVARVMLDAVALPPRAVAEEILLRPWGGDL